MYDSIIMRSPDRNTIFLGSAIGVTMLMAGCGWLSNKVLEEKEQKDLGLKPDETPQADVVTNFDQTEVQSTSTKGKVNGMTGVFYPDAEKVEPKNKECVAIPEGGTVVGAAVALGKNPNAFNDILKGSVYAPDGALVEEFTNEALPTTANVPVNTIVCANVLNDLVQP